MWRIIKQIMYMYLTRIKLNWKHDVATIINNLYAFYSIDSIIIIKCYYTTLPKYIQGYDPKVLFSHIYLFENTGNGLRPQ